MRLRKNIKSQHKDLKNNHDLELGFINGERIGLKNIISSII